MKKKIKVFLCDDHKLFRQGVRKLLELEDDIQISGEAERGEEAIERIRENPPDVVLMDINMPGMNGVDVTQKIKNENPKINIIMLTIYDDEPHIFLAIKAGAVGYLLKDVSADVLINAVRQIVKEESLIDPKIAGKIIKEFKLLSEGKKSLKQKNYADLTGRENEVLRWIALGASNREIASKLNISEKTVKNHISNIFQKLHINSRTQAALYVFKEKKLSF